MKFSVHGSAISIIVASILATAHVEAQTSQVRADTAKVVSIPAGDLKSALELVAKQTGVELLFDSQQLRGTHTAGVSGTLTTREAVEKLLEGTRLELSTDESTGAMMIGEGERKPVSAAENKRELRVAQADEEKSSPAAVGGEKLEEVKPELEKIPEVLVKGSKSLNTDIQRSENAAQPYMVFGREEIDRSGVRTLEEFFRQKLTADTSANGTALSTSASSNSFTSSINLRGLGPNQTLILVDGRRLAGRNGISVGSLQPDLNGIPLAAVERIEVLPTTASGIYGGSATGGVVNVILRRDYSGVETKLTYTNSFDAGAATRSADLGAGFNLESGRTNILIAASWTDGDELNVGDRSFLQRARNRIAANNPAGIAALGEVNPPTGATTNIRSSDGSPLQFKADYGGAVLPSSFTSVPEGYAGPASDDGAGLVARAGQYNLRSTHTSQVDGAARALLSAPTIKSAMATIRREFTPWLSGFLEGSISKSETFATSFGGSGSYTLGPEAPENPFQQSIRITTPLLGIDDDGWKSDYRSTRGSVGAIARLSGQWSLSTDFTWNQTRQSTAAFEPLDFFALLTALGSGSTSSGDSFSVFRDNGATGLDFTQFLVPAATNAISPTNATTQNTALRLGGPLRWYLPGGAPTVSALLEHRKDELDEIRFVTADPSSLIITPSISQSVDSAYAELTLPFVSSQNERFAMKVVELQLAGRVDRYRTNGANSITETNGVPDDIVRRATNKTHSVDPTVALRFGPSEDVTLRASYGTGFLPPNPGQLISTLNPAIDAGAFGLVDPLRGNQPLGIIDFLFGGSADLDPEKSTSRSAGIIFTPRLLPGLRFSADWTRIRKHAGIASFDVGGSTQDLLNAYIQYFPDRVTRAAPSDGFDVGPITRWDTSLVNVATQKVIAWDFSASYLLNTQRWGSFSLDSRATHLSASESQLNPLLPVVDTLGTRAALKWRWNASINWDYRAWAVTWTTRWLDGYFLNADHTLVVNQGSAKVPSQIYHDLSASYSFEDHSVGWLSGLELRFGVSNVFNRKPPFDAAASNYYSLLGDPRLATYTLAVKKAFD